MFQQFESMFKGKGTALHNKITQKQDYSKTPQKFNIKGRQIQEKKLLSEGAFGFIWLAEDTTTKQQFALKRVICPTQQSYQAALYEKKIYQELPESEHIVGFYGGLTFKNQGRNIVITLMQLCSNGNLFDLLQKMEGKGLPEDTIKKIARSVLKSLIVIHRAGYIHRDIKIQNILVNKKNVMKVCDFGSCTNQIIDFKEVLKSQYQITQDKIYAFTTPMYRPPEIVDPYLQYKVSSKTDLWMLGCVLYTMSYFVHPFVETNTVGISNGVFRFPEYPNQTQHKVSDKMKDFIRNLLTPNPASRPTAQKMLQLLQKWDSLDSIPLNQQAKKLKIEHQKKQESMKKMHRKLIDYDGDIPQDQIMKLQQKIMRKNKNEGQYQTKSFIIQKDANKKKAPKQNDQQKKQPVPVPNINKIKPLPNLNQNVQIKKQKQKQKKNADFDLWGAFETKKTTTTNNNVDFKGFSDFDDFSQSKNTSKIEKPQKLASKNDFVEFFSTNQTPITVPKTQKGSNNNKKKNDQVNLLDI